MSEIKREILDEQAVRRAVSRISYEIVEKNQGAEDVCIVGIITRGVVLGEMMASRIGEIEGKAIPFGALDVSGFRDDREGERALGETEIEFDVKDKTIVLVDDVLYTGRTIRAAIDCIMQLGRPKRIQLAVLVDRGHRELPLRPDYVGKNVPLSREENVRVLLEPTDGETRAVICKGDEKR